MALIGLAGPASAQAPGGFAITYDIYFKGMQAGLYSYRVARSGDAYEAKADQRATGLARAVVKNRQDYSYAAKGLVTANGLSPQTYRHSGGKKGRVVDVTFTADDIVTVANPSMGMGNPPASKAQKAGAIDQISLIYALATPKGDPCDRTMKVYLDGAKRFDLVLKPNGAQKISSGAFKGQARKCSVQFKPIAGFSDPIEPATMTFLLAPVGGGMYAPIDISMPTDDGMARLAAKSYAPA
jgi:hypothetical protein